MTFDEYAEKYLSALTPEGRRLVQMGWNGHEEFGGDQAARAQGGKAVGVVDFSGVVQWFKPYTSPPAGTELYTRTGASVPDSWKAAAAGAMDFAIDLDSVRRYPQVAAEHIKGLARFICTAPQPEGDGWKPYYEYPEIGKPVLGCHRDWVDEDFCKDGIRECFTFGDGSEWQSARWDGYSDQWIVEDGAPELWHPHPQPPQRSNGDE